MDFLTRCSADNLSKPHTLFDVSHLPAIYSEAGGMSAAESNHAQRVLSALNQQRAVGRFCDASLNVGDGVVFLAHRNILACFTELLQQSNVPSATEFCLQGCPSDGLELLLNFVYTGELKLDPHNLDRVQQAAASLCVPEALTRCQQFKETSKEPVPVKRKRGRPRKSASDITKYEPTIDTAAASFTTAATTTATTTRSGRVVKSSRRLVTIDESPTTENELAPPLPVEKEVGDAVVEENQNSDQLAGETEVEYNNISMKKIFQRRGICADNNECVFKEEYRCFYYTCLAGDGAD